MYAANNCVLVTVVPSANNISFDVPVLVQNFVALTPVGNNAFCNES